LVQATNDHDLDGIVACFGKTYVNETPAHPARGFEGQEQVRRNWSRILDGVPDVTAEVVSSVTDGGTVWSEWRMSGTRRDGAVHEMRGVIIFRVTGEVIDVARFYLEPVEYDSGSVDDAVSRAATPSPAGVTS
jgi:ketosteroid isomerase-like protein